MAKKGQKFNSYSPELKLKYVKILTNGEASFREVVAELGTDKSTVKRWQDQYLKYGEDYFFEEHILWCKYGRSTSICL